MKKNYITEMLTTLLAARKLLPPNLITEALLEIGKILEENNVKLEYAQAKQLVSNFEENPAALISVFTEIHSITPVNYDTIKAILCYGDCQYIDVALQLFIGIPNIINVTPAECKAVYEKHLLPEFLDLEKQFDSKPVTLKEIAVHTEEPIKKLIVAYLNGNNTEGPSRPRNLLTFLDRPLPLPLSYVVNLLTKRTEKAALPSDDGSSRKAGIFSRPSATLAPRVGSPRTLVC